MPASTRQPARRTPAPRISSLPSRSPPAPARSRWSPLVPPHAAAKVFAADWPMTLVGLDVTERTICTPADLDIMRAPSPRCGAFMTHAAEFYFKFHKESEGIDGCHLHDPSAVIAALDMSAFETASAPLAVTLDGEKAGMTRETEAGPPIDICVGVDSAAVMARFRAHMSSGRLP